MKKTLLLLVFCCLLLLSSATSPGADAAQCISNVGGTCNSLQPCCSNPSQPLVCVLSPLNPNADGSCAIPQPGVNCAGPGDNCYIGTGFNTSTMKDCCIAQNPPLTCKGYSSGINGQTPGKCVTQQVGKTCGGSGGTCSINSDCCSGFYCDVPGGFSTQGTCKSIPNNCGNAGDKCGDILPPCCTDKGLTCDLAGGIQAATGTCVVPTPVVGPTQPTFNPFPSPPAPPCAQFGADGTCLQVNTALGAWPVDASGFITRLFGTLLALSGGIALLIIIYSGYELLTSQGKPEQVNRARERLTSAIVGLLFLIFSLVILETVGVDVLQIPGWGDNATSPCKPVAGKPC